MAPLAYWLATDEHIAEVCNGCGPQGWKGKIIPDTIWGLRITGCCDVHDWQYHYGRTKEDKERADNVLLANIYRRINKKTEWRWLRRLRRRRAKTYYLVVSKCGDKYYNAEEV